VENDECRHFEGSIFMKKQGQTWLNLAFSNEVHCYYFIRYMHLLKKNIVEILKESFFNEKSQGIYG
jgi:hypothetical protein